MSTAKKRYLVSACLAGVPCRFDSGRREHPAVIRLLRDGQALPVCPEQLGGLSTPRPACEIKDSRVQDRDGTDFTDAYRQGAEEAMRLARLAGCTAAVLQPRSPSCGFDRIYDGTFGGVLVPGDGLFAALCREQGLELLTPEDMEDVAGETPAPETP